MIAVAGYLLPKQFELGRQNLPAWIGVKENPRLGAAGLETSSSEQAANPSGGVQEGQMILLDEKAARRVAGERGTPRPPAPWVYWRSRDAGLVDLRLRSTTQENQLPMFSPRY